MDRSAPFNRVVAGITPHFVTRQIFAGAGKVGAETAANDGIPVDFQLSQRAEFFEEPVGLETTLKRPIVNTRDEPHAIPTATAGSMSSSGTPTSPRWRPSSRSGPPHWSWR